MEQLGTAQLVEIRIRGKIMVTKKEIEERIKWLEGWVFQAKSEKEENKYKGEIEGLEWVISKLEK